MGIKLYDHQVKALNNMMNGCILCGGVGTGKSITALSYYYTQEGGQLDPIKPMKAACKDLYIITTARKRDEKEWDKELLPFLLSVDHNEYYQNKVVIDSWNNIKKYVDVKGAFFIFDEQRVVGSGEWVKAFYKITKINDWILLSATPGDTWMDYIPVFVANGFFKNKTQFINEHVCMDYTGKYPKVLKYYREERLIRLRNKILVNMDFKKPAQQHHETIWCTFDRFAYKDVFKTRWNYDKDEPIENASELCYQARKVINMDHSRCDNIAYVMYMLEHPKLIIFYNYDYELDAIKKRFGDNPDIEIAEWNGHKHQPVPESERWIYLVQYAAGSEAWNCIKTNTIIFYSQSYSYKVMTQASGRIDRLNTPYKDLFYYHFKSHAGIDLAIDKALTEKKKFNEMNYIRNQRNENLE